jgi:signal peptidase I
MNRFKLWDYGTVMAGALMAALIVRYEFVEAYKIPSDSMAPTLLVGDNLLANKLLYGLTLPFSNRKIFALASPRRLVLWT